MASLWVPPTPTSRGAEALARLEPSQVEVAEMTPDGVRIEVHGPRRPGGTRAGGEEAALRERAHGRCARPVCSSPVTRAGSAAGSCRARRYGETGL